MELFNEMVGFRYEYDINLTIDELQAQNNKTYIVYVAQLFQSNKKNKVNLLLDIIDCTSPDLEGYKCLDFSKVSNYTFDLNNEERVQTQIRILTYGCLDLDNLKQTIPNNCASQTEIDNVINGLNSLLSLKLYTSQFNTTSQKIQVNYRNSFVNTFANQLIFSRVKTQKQISSVKTGFLIQSEMSFSSPIQYDQRDQALDRSYALETMGLSCYSYVMIYPDELVQYIGIQFPTLPQVIASVNITFTILMLLGHIGRAISNRTIRQRFFMLFLKRLYQSNYLSMLGQIVPKQQQKQKNNKQQKQLMQIQQQQQQQTDTNQQKLQCQNQQIDEAFKIDKYQQEQQFSQLSIDIKNEDEQKQNNSIPLFYYRPILNLSNRQQQQDNSDKSQQEQSQNLEVLADNQLIKQASKEKFSQEDALKQNKYSQIQKQIIEDQQTSNINFEQVDSFKNKSYQEKSNIKDSQQNLFFSCNLGGTACMNTNRSNRENQQKQNQTQVNQCKKDGHDIKECVKNLEVIQNSDIYDEVYSHIFGFRFCKKRQKSGFLENLSQNHKNEIQNHISQDLNILNFINDVIFLKKAVMLLLRKDQLAALMLIGFSPFIQANQTNDVNKNQKKIIKSYYEKQQAILKSEKLQQNQTVKFLKRCHDNQKMSDIDFRILQSLKANQII